MKARVPLDVKHRTAVDLFGVKRTGGSQITDESLFRDELATWMQFT